MNGWEAQLLRPQLKVQKLSRKSQCEEGWWWDVSLQSRGLGSAAAKVERPRFKEPVPEKFHQEN